MFLNYKSFYNIFIYRFIIILYRLFSCLSRTGAIVGTCIDTCYTDKTIIPRKPETFPYYIKVIH